MYARVGWRIDAGETASGGPVARGQASRAFEGAFDQPGELLARAAADPLQKAQHHGLGRPPEPDILEAPDRRADKRVPLVRGDRKVDQCGATKKGLKLGQGLSLLVVQLDHHDLNHDRSRPPFRLILHWNHAPMFRRIPHWIMITLCNWPRAITMSATLD